jgi:hypothetical protein
MTRLPEPPASPDPELSHLYRLAEGIVAAVTQPAPDWCAIAKAAQALTELIQDRCTAAGSQ